MKKLVKRLALLWLPALMILAGCGPGAAPEAKTTTRTTDVSPAATSIAAPDVAPKAAWQGKWETTLAAAKKEGRVTIVTFIGPETRDALIKAFPSQYGIALEFVVGTAGDTLAKMQAERRAGLYTMDGTINGTSSILPTGCSAVKDRSPLPQGLEAPVPERM